MAEGTAPNNVGGHLARRLVEVGVETFFTVPGDFNLVLLDQLLLQKGLRMVNCCNELNAGYAADGYARVNGFGVVVVTFTVGGLSAINAVAGAYSSNLPLLLVSGGPNSNDFSRPDRVLHHTIGKPDFSQQLECFKQVTIHQEVIRDPATGAEQVDRAIAAALRNKKPVYIELSCNLAGRYHPTCRADKLVPLFPMVERASNAGALAASVADAAAVLNTAVKPVILVGTNVETMHHHAADVSKLVEELAAASGYAVAVMPNAKGKFSEQHASFIGTYWGHVSTPFCCEVVESADVVLALGPMMNDYTTVGYSTLLQDSKLVVVGEHGVTICGDARYGVEGSCVSMRHFLPALAAQLRKNPTSLEAYRRMAVGRGLPAALGQGGKLLNNVFAHHVEAFLTGDHILLAETGDSWFNAQKMKLPDGCSFQFQMQYGSIGWAVGACLGASAAGAIPHIGKRVIAMIGDGSFQVTAQDVSTMIRFAYNPIIFLVNNNGYTIEVEIHDGPYNNIPSWNYTKVVEALAGDMPVHTATCATEEALLEALEMAKARTDAPVFIEVVLDRDDCTPELLEWGSRVAAANGRKPNPC